MKMTKQQAIETLKSLLLNIAGEKDCEAIELAIAALQSDPDAPDWSQAPEWARWYAIDGDGQRLKGQLIMVKDKLKLIIHLNE